MTGTIDKSAAGPANPQSLAPTGKLGFRGRRATLKERAQILEEFS